jgi:ABC-type Fe3+/spermidine/putrescine transport system ATPase subunit
MTEDLVIKGLSKSFGKEKVLQNLDLEIKEGSMVSLLGPSGCGKSTTLKIIAGLMRQDNGTVRLGGKSLDRVPPHKRKIGFVFQSYALFPHLDVMENVEFGMRMKKIQGARRKERSDELLHLVGMHEMKGKMPHQLSGGQKQRVAIARALAIDPEVLLLDEPFGALDVKIRRKLRRDLKLLQKELGITTLFVTHDQEEAFELGDVTAVMDKGRIEQIGRPRDLYEEPRSAFVARFVGNVNVIELPGTDKVTVMVRPEDIRMTKITAGEPVPKVSGTMVNYNYFGPVIECMVTMANGETMTVLMPREEFKSRNVRRGDAVKLKILKFRSFKG